MSGHTTKTGGSDWPVWVGEYFILSKSASIAVSTLASDGLAESVAGLKPEGLCIIGKTETENIGIDKIVKNTVANSAIRFLIVTGRDPQGHCSGASLLALAKRGIDNKGRIIGSPGKHPVLMNSTKDEVEIFREQVEVVDMIGSEDTIELISKIESLRDRQLGPFMKQMAEGALFTPEIVTVEGNKDKQHRLDKKGYFVLLPDCETNDIIVEYYAYDNRLLKAIRGNNARDLYTAIIKNGWISELSHAAYIGKELEKAELSLRYGFKYVQDGA